MREAGEQHQRGVGLSIKSSEVVERSGVNGLLKEAQLNFRKLNGSSGGPIDY